MHVTLEIAINLMLNYFLRYGSNVCYLNTFFKHAGNVLNITKLLFIQFIDQELFARYLMFLNFPRLERRRRQLMNRFIYLATESPVLCSPSPHLSNLQ